MTTSITSPVPRTAERLLEALGADPDFRDALLGDMAEEYAIRAAYDGGREAGRWYRREALRVAPHLLRDWARHLRWRGAARLAGIVMTAHVLSTLFLLPAFVLVMRAAAATGVLLPNGRGPAPDASPVAWAVLALLTALRLATPVLGGYVAAALDRETPLVAALALGAASAVTGLSLVGLLAPGAVPLSLQLAQTILVLAGTSLGGGLRVWTDSRRAAVSLRSAME